MNVKNLRLITIVLPIAYILGVEVFSLVVLLPFSGSNAILRLLLVFALLVIGGVPFSFWVFATIERRIRDLAEANDAIERRNQELRVVNGAITSISGALDLSHVLQEIVDASRDLVQARYAALGVTDPSGRILQFITSGITPEQRAALGPLPQGHGLLAAIISDGKPLRIPDIAKDPRSYGFPANHPPMTSLLGVPILFKGKPVGDLYLTDKIGANEFSQEDQDLIILLANHAAVAIDNARLFEEVRAGRDRLQAWSEELEERVAARTREIADSSKMLTTRVLQAQEEERKRIARELHDDTAQSLSTLLINLDMIDPHVSPNDATLRAGFERVREIATRTLDATRALSHDLRPTILDDFGLTAALRWYAGEYTRTFEVPVHVYVEPANGALTPDIELALFRIAQEALTNSGKYAEASSSSVVMTFPDGMIKLVVEDNGKGFEQSDRTGPSRHGGLGMYGMEERAELLGGSLMVESEPGNGTRVTALIPLARPEPDGALIASGGPQGDDMC
jgi:signal transduction histidine kinase